MALPLLSILKGMARCFAIFALLLFLAGPTWGKAAFLPPAELVRKADAIVVVDLDEPETVADSDPFQNPSQSPGYYRKKAQAKVVERIQGDIPDRFVIYGDEAFICAQCPLSKGRFLAFLSRKGDFWIGTNWHLSLRPIKGDQVQWVAVDSTTWDFVSRNLREVIVEIRTWTAQKSDP